MFTLKQTLNKARGSLILCALVVIFVALSVNCWASLTGKISGTIIDSETGAPILNATISILETDYSAIADEDGEFYMMAVPAGSYSLTVIAPGYLVYTKENTRVLLDLTTPVDVALTPRTSLVTDPVTVIAEAPLVQKDLTASRYTLTAEQMAYLPNGISIADVLSNMSGTVTGADGALHVRGGRTGEITYIYDGVTVTDPVTRNLGLRIVPDFLEEIDLTSGGFPAEYGEAGSGVVNAVTREGTERFTGSIKMYDGSTHKYNPLTGDIEELTRSDNQALTANLSGPLSILGLDKTYFFIAGEGLRDGGYLPHSFLESGTFSGKLTSRPIAGLKLTATGTYYRVNRSTYDHRDVNGISYDFNQDGLPISKGEANVLGLRMDYARDPNTIIHFGVSHFESKTKTAPEHLFDKHWSEWPGFVADSTGKYDPANGTLHINNYDRAPEYGYVGYTFGDDFDPRYRLQSTKYNSINLSVTRQLDKRNQTKIGGEYRRYDILWDSKQFYNPTPFGESYNYQPSYGYTFVQHKLEYHDVIINAGLRYDYLSSRVAYFEDPLDKANSEIKVSTPKSQISPRLGISHPVGYNTILRFNYGYFFQPPKYWTMYTNLDGEVNSGFPLIGNPELEPEKTMAYEVGLNHALSSSVILDVTAFYKDIENLIATRAIDIFGPQGVVTGFVNEDYSSVKGFDIALEKRRSRYLAGAVNYSLMFARGNSPAETFAYYNVITDPDETLPVKAYPLDFDQRHTLIVNADLRTPHDWKGKLFGVIPLSGAWGVNVVARYGSGLPYTKYNLKTGQRIGGINSFSLPPVYRIDTRFNRDFYFHESGKFLSLFVEIENLFNRRNVVNVYAATGLPDDDGVDYSDGGALVTDKRAGELYDLIINDPQNFGPPRTIRLGLQFNF